MRLLLVAATLLTAAPAVGATAFTAQDLALQATAAPPPVTRTQTPPASAPQIIEETDLDRQTRALASQLRCVVCQGLSVEDSPSQLAQEMRALVREQLELGRTPAEVKQFFVDKYGEWVLLEPDPVGFNLLVYVLPVVMLVGGAAFVYMTARRMVRSPGVGDNVADEVGDDIADEARTR